MRWFVPFEKGTPMIPIPETPAEFILATNYLRARGDVDISDREQNLANEVVDLHARLRAYEDVAGVTTRLRNALEDAADTLQWLAAGQEIVYAHDVDVVARGMRDTLRELGDA